MKYFLGVAFTALFILLAACSTSGTPRAPAQEGAKSDFLSLCKVALEGSQGAASICPSLNKTFFSKAKTVDIAPFEPAQVDAPSEAIDKKIQFIAFNDPNFLAGMAYCYFVFRNWIDFSKSSPDEIALSASGFSILNEDLKEYQNWLDGSKPGKSCKARVESESQVPIGDLGRSLKGYVALIGLNPLASVRDKGANLDAIQKDMKVTVNHERIHAYQVLCPTFDLWSRQQWLKLSPAEKEKVVKKYPIYKWNDLKVAGREFVAFAFEEHPEKVPALIGECKVD